MNVELLENYSVTVEFALQRLGIDPEQARDNRFGRWLLQRGSAYVSVNLLISNSSEAPMLVVIAPLFTIPADHKYELCQELLEFNERMFAAGYAVKDEVAYLISMRECYGMDQIEAYNIINRLGIYADHDDDYFREKYGARFTDVDDKPILELVS